MLMLNYFFSNVKLRACLQLPPIFTFNGAKFVALIVDCKMNEITELPVNKVKKYNVEEVFSCETSTAEQRINLSKGIKCRHPLHNLHCISNC